MAEVLITFWHNRLLDIVGIKIRNRLFALSGRAEILELLFWTGILKNTAKTLSMRFMLGDLHVQCRLDLSNFWK